MSLHSRFAKSTKNLSKITVVLIFIFVFFLVFFSIKEYVNKKKLDAEIIALNQEIKALSTQKQDFLQTIDHYNSDFFVEKEARSKLNLKKPGENVVVVKLDDINSVDSEPSGQGSSGEVMTPKSNLVLWWNYFFYQ